MKGLAFFILLASVTAAAQKNEITASAVGNFNPVTYVNIQQTIPTMGSSQKSSIGGGVEYNRWFNPSHAFGIVYEQNPSDGKLHGASNGKWYIFPLMRYELLGMFTQRFSVVRTSPYGPEGIRQVSRLTPFLEEGAGAVVTRETDPGNNGLAGWSHTMAFSMGVGSDYWINRRLSFRISTVILADQTGCYDDPTCAPTWGLSHDLKTGFTWKW